MATENLATLWHWSPTLGAGLLQNIQISVGAIGLGTLLGLLVGTLLLSPLAPLRVVARLWVQVFRNAPWLVLIYFTSYVFPFDVQVAGTWVAFPDWLKVTVGLALPASANVAEIFRGAVASIPGTQWEAARSLAFSRGQIFRSIILPQCLRRMLPPWMNLYAVVTMGTALASLVGVHDLIDSAQVAANTVNRSGFTVLVYFSVLALFFAYCYPIARLTQRLERRYAF
ncbi:Polar amino acid ABC transporter, inner membrane subunit [Pseudomonas sp. JV551A1]|jgi:polar amino acid transport system permease protein|uniref:Polar amino acid ABC transporter, inner membrane subunit n=1 Tax=Pseudomonas inefficax TaxID=2078786 RepID=A0AAQ1PBY9_9PSED|nr:MULTISPECIES: amino acid ABC transporter permease [Pseudomonas]MEC4563152.1 amino acid ABC transporter permease [Pseudomonas sp. CMAA1741]SPO55327.1 Polar amino acid ABC transporter, inner membrane subunit [Pseudomonas sp. JV551A1]SPO61445.1 Polar amino acid ABC transporter, inner membrane subunit [Pseudomonas inefficax]